MRLLTLSAIKMLPLASMATPTGQLKIAAVPVPSAKAPAPLPARVVTTPPGETFRTRLLPQSPTTTLPPASMPTPEGQLKEADSPSPLANAIDPLPASELTAPEGVTLRIL